MEASSIRFSYYTSHKTRKGKRGGGAKEGRTNVLFWNREINVSQSNAC